MLPLLAFGVLNGLMGGGAALRDWYTRKQQLEDAQGASGTIGSLLGSAPSLMYPGGEGSDQAGPPQQVGGSGLMADPTDPRKQLSFAQGLMGLRPEDRAAAAPIFEAIMGRATQQAAQQATLADAKDKFEYDKQIGGEKWALEQLQRRQDLARGNLQLQLEQIKLRDAKNPPADSGVQLGPVPADHVRVQTPQGIITMPLPGSEAYNKERDTQQGLADLHGTISELDNLVKKHGTEAFNSQVAGRMKYLYGEAVSKLATLGETGKVSKEQLKEMEGRLEDPSGWMNVYKNTDKVRAGYDEAKKSVMRELAKARARTSGWIGFDSPLAAGGPARAAGGIPPLPPGTVLRAPGAAAGASGSY